MRTSTQALRLPGHRPNALRATRFQLAVFQTRKKKECDVLEFEPSSNSDRPRYFASTRHTSNSPPKGAAKNRLPAMYPNSEYVETGGLMSYAADLVSMFRHSAIYVDKILKGTKPADLPVEQPKKFEFIINRKAAKQVGLTISPNVLARADKVIK